MRKIVENNNYLTRLSHFFAVPKAQQKFLTFAPDVIIFFSELLHFLVQCTVEM